MTDQRGGRRRALVIVPFPLDEEGLANRRRQVEELAAPPLTSFEFRCVKMGPDWFDSPHDLLLADVGIFEAGMHAEDEGFDAVVIDTVSDSGVDALRSVLSIPVIGPARVMYLAALILGNRFSVLTQWDRWKASYEKSLRAYGLTSQCASVRSINVRPDVRALLEGKDQVPELLRQAGERCIAEDGAQAIVMGSTTMHDAVEYLQEHLSVPVINPGPLSYAMTDVLLSLGLTQSRRLYPMPHSPQLDSFAAMAQAAAGLRR